MNWKSLLIRWGILAVAIALTTWLLPGIRVEGNGILTVLAVAVVLGFVNAIVRPILALLSCGFIVLTLGLFLFVVNALALLIASYISVNWLGLGFYVDGFWPALWGSILISLIATVLSAIIPGDEPRPATTTTTLPPL